MVGVGVSEGAASGAVDAADAIGSAELASAIGGTNAFPEGGRPPSARPPTTTAVPIATVAVAARIRRLRRRVSGVGST